MRRSPFVLLEVLIAIAIVALVTSVLFYNSPVKVRKEQAALFDLEKERLWESELMNIKKDLPSYVETLPPDRNKALLQPCKPWKIIIDKDTIKTIHKQYYIWVQLSKEGPDKTRYYKVHLLENEKSKKKPDYTFFVTLPPK
jgi:hypothetical protein